MTKSATALDEKQASRIQHTDTFKREWLLAILSGMKANYSGSHTEDVKTLSNPKIESYQAILNAVIAEYKKEAAQWMKNNRPKGYNDYAIYLSSTQASIGGHHYARMLGIILAQVKNAYPNDIKFTDDAQSNLTYLKGFDAIKAPTLSTTNYKFIIPASQFSIGHAYVDANEYLSAWKTNECFSGSNKRIFDAGAGPNRNNRFIGELGPNLKAGAIHDFIDKNRDIQFINNAYARFKVILDDIKLFEAPLKTMPAALQSEVKQAYLFKFLNNQMKKLESQGIPVAKAAELVNAMKKIGQAYLADKKPEECLAIIPPLIAQKKGTTTAIAAQLASAQNGTATPKEVKETVAAFRETALEPASPTGSPRSRSSAIDSRESSESRSLTETSTIQMDIANVISSLQNPSTKEQMKDQILNNQVKIVFDVDKDFLKQATQLKSVDPEVLQVLTDQYKAEREEAIAAHTADPRAFGI